MPRLRVLWFSPPARELWTINREQKRPRLLFPGLGRGQPQQPGTVVPTGSRAPPHSDPDLGGTCDHGERASLLL